MYASKFFDLDADVEGEDNRDEEDIQSLCSIDRNFIAESDDEGIAIDTDIYQARFEDRKRNRFSDVINSLQNKYDTKSTKDKKQLRKANSLVYSKKKLIKKTKNTKLTTSIASGKKRSRMENILSWERKKLNTSVKPDATNVKAEATKPIQIKKRKKSTLEQLYELTPTYVTPPIESCRKCKQKYYVSDKSRHDKYECQREKKMIQAYLDFKRK